MRMRPAHLSASPAVLPRPAGSLWSAAMTKRALLLLPMALAACSTEREPPPQPAPRPQARPAPAPPPAPSPAPVGWADLPLTPGSWTYEGPGSTSSATFGTPGAPQFRIYCEGPTRSVFLQRYGAYTGRTMSIRTSFGARSLAFAPEPTPQLGTATLTARDPFLDDVAFSRGRVSVEVAGTPTLVMPAWAEPARVIEDCRKMAS